MASYPPYPRGPAARRKTHKVMGEYKRRTLRSSSGAKVHSREQAVAIALSEARKAAARKRYRKK